MRDYILILGLLGFCLGQDYSLSFDGVDDYVSIDGDVLHSKNDFNIETKIIVIGASTNARSEVPVTIKPNTVITT